MSRSLTPLERARDFERTHLPAIPAEERPLFHLTPPVGWMNDPNGFCYYRGQYHLFYQYHPYALHWGPMHWGHAVSRDLLRWTYLPCALAPDTEADAEGCFSGSAVPLRDGRLMLAYTGLQASGVQAQCVAFGDGQRFEKAAENPVIRQAHLPEGFSGVDFRDPKVWLAEDGAFRMVVACRHARRQGTILYFSSPDGLDWRFLGEIDASLEEYGRMWECPDFFELEGRQVLLVSPQEMHAREEFHAGHGTVCFLGSFEEEGCRFVRESVQPVDQGLSFYAPQTTVTPDGRRIMVAWMDDWETCEGAPRCHPWYAQMTVPRELFLRGGRLMQRPVREIERLWRDTVLRPACVIQEETGLPGVRGRLLDMTLTLYPEGTACRRFTLRLARDGERFTEIRWYPALGELVFDRSRSGSRRDIVHSRRVRAEAREGRLTLRLLMDRESAELFINDGERVVTSLIPASPEAGDITFAADAPLRLDVAAHPLG